MWPLLLSYSTVKHSNEVDDEFVLSLDVHVLARKCKRSKTVAGLRLVEYHLCDFSAGKMEFVSSDIGVSEEILRRALIDLNGCDWDGLLA